MLPEGEDAAARGADASSSGSTRTRGCSAGAMSISTCAVPAADVRARVQGAGTTDPGRRDGSADLTGKGH